MDKSRFKKYDRVAIQEYTLALKEMRDEGRKLLTKGDLKKYFSISRNTVYQWRQAGKKHSGTINGRHRWKIIHLIEWLDYVGSNHID